MNLKRVISFLVSVVLLFALCSCGNVKYAGMKNYANSHANISVISIEEHIYDDKNKIMTLIVYIPSDANPSLEDLNGLRIALEEYMQKDGGFLDQGWQVSILVDNYMVGPVEPQRCAVYANFSDGYNLNALDGTGYIKCSTTNSLVTFWFCLTPDDVPYISELYGVENIHIGGRYSDSDTLFLDGTISEIRELKDLKTVAVCYNWYDAFSNAGLECKISVTNEAGDDWYNAPLSP